MPRDTGRPAAVQAIRDSARWVLRRYGMATASTRPQAELLIIGTNAAAPHRCGGTSRNTPSVLANFPRRENTKGMYFFSENYCRGERWYRSHFPSKFVRRRVRSATQRVTGGDRRHAIRPVPPACARATPPRRAGGHRSGTAPRSRGTARSRTGRSGRSTAKPCRSRTRSKQNHGAVRAQKHGSRRIHARSASLTGISHIWGRAPTCRCSSAGVRRFRPISCSSGSARSSMPSPNPISTS